MVFTSVAGDDISHICYVLDEVKLTLLVDNRFFSVFENGALRYRFSFETLAEKRVSESQLVRVQQAERLMQQNPFASLYANLYASLYVDLEPNLAANLTDFKRL